MLKFSKNFKLFLKSLFAIAIFWLEVDLFLEWFYSNVFSITKTHSLVDISSYAFSHLSNRLKFGVKIKLNNIFFLKNSNEVFELRTISRYKRNLLGSRIGEGERKYNIIFFFRFFRITFFKFLDNFEFNFVIKAKSTQNGLLLRIDVD